MRSMVWQCRILITGVVCVRKITEFRPSNHRCLKTRPITIVVENLTFLPYNCISCGMPLASRRALLNNKKVCPDAIRNRKEIMRRSNSP